MNAGAQQQEMAQYDQEESEILEDMSQALSRLNEMSTVINVEIKEQDMSVYFWCRCLYLILFSCDQHASTS